MRRSAFTLIELLVVITLIALLLAILIPVLSRSRQTARTVICSSNIKQLLTALRLYEIQNGSLPYGFDTTRLRPPPDGWPGFRQYDMSAWWWFSYIEGFVDEAERKKTVLQCPAKRLSDPLLQVDILCGNYGVNQSLCKNSTGPPEFTGTPVRSDGLSSPGMTLLVLDSGYSVINWQHAADEPPHPLGGAMIMNTAYVPGLEINKDRVLWPGQWDDAVNGRHPGKTVNAGFADGHVARKKASELLVEKKGNNYRNRTPLWLPKK